MNAGRLRESSVLIPPPVASRVDDAPARLRPFGARSARWLSLAPDAINLLLLVVVAAEVFFRLVPLLGFADDSWTASYMLDRGTLPILNLDISNAVTMPYQDRRWLYEVPYHVARLLGDGSVTSYNVFLYACQTLTAVLVYAVARVLFPGRPGWALIAGLLKLVYPADSEVYSSAILPQAWGECLMVLALLCLLILLGARRLRAPIRVALSVLMFVAVMFPIGTYESTWPLVLLAAPLLTLAVALRDGQGGRTLPAWALGPLAVWYAGALLSMAVFVARLALSPTLRTDADRYIYARGPAEWLGRVARGLEAALVGVLDIPFRHLAAFVAGRVGMRGLALSQYVPLASARELAVLLLVGVAVVVVVWWQRRTIRRSGFDGRLLLGFGVGLLLVVAALLPPTLNGEPDFGTRYLHFAAYGAVIVLVSIFIWAERITRRPTLVAAVGALVIVVWGFYLGSVGTYYGEVGRQTRRFFYQLRTELPSIQDGTIVVLQDSPRSGDMYEHVTTMILRAFTGTHTSYLLSDSVVKIADNPSLSTVRLVTCNDLAGPPDPALERGYWAMAPCVLDVVNNAPSIHTADVPRDRIVWLRWDAPTQTLHLDERRSAMQRVDRDARSDFGSLLFPDEPAASGSH